MEGNPAVTIIYRMAEKKSKTSKVKPDWINNQSCLRNLRSSATDAMLIVFGDRLTDSKDVAIESADAFFETEQHGNAETFVEVLEYAVDNFDPNDIIYFVEDDYLHKPGFVDILMEGLQIADYVSLYDHPDKYPGNSDLLLTKSTHWRRVESTTMTFAAKVKTLAFDYNIFKEMCAGQVIPPDYYIFTHLVRNLKRRLITPIPAQATHGETQWLSPFCNWEELSK